MQNTCTDNWLLVYTSWSDDSTGETLITSEETRVITN